MLTNPRNAFTGQSTSPNMVPFEMLRMASSCAIVTLSLRRTVFPIFDFKKCRDLEIRARGHSRSLKVVPLDRLRMIWIVFYRNCVRDLETRVRVTQFIENDTIRSGTHDFLLTFHRNHRPILQRFWDKRRFPSKIANFSTPCTYRPRCASFRNWVLAQGVKKAQMMGLPDGRKSFKIGLVV